MNHTSLFLFYWLPFLIYITLIVFVSSQSHLPSAVEHVPDKVSHFLEYAVFAFLFLRALTQGMLSLSKGRSGWIVLIGGALFGASDELYQSFIPNRTCSLYDWIADVAGITGMITLIIIWNRFKEGPATQTI